MDIATVLTPDERQGPHALPRSDTGAGQALVPPSSLEVQQQRETSNISWAGLASIPGVSSVARNGK